MASSKLLLPSSAALFQSSPVSSTPFFCDRHRYLTNPPLRPFQPLLLQTHPIDPCFAGKFSSDGDEALSFSDGFTTSEDEGSDDEELLSKSPSRKPTYAPPAEGAERTANTRRNVEELLSKSSSRKPTYTPKEGAARTVDSGREVVEGALSKYVWSKPRKEAIQLTRDDRVALVESLATTQSNLLIQLDKARFKLAPSDFGGLLQRLIEERKWDKVGLVFDWMKVNKKLRSQSLSVYITLMGKAGFHYKALRAYRGLTDMDLKLNKFVCNALLKSLVDAGSLEKAFTLFEEIKANGFIPDAYSYSTVIAGCAKRQGAYDKARNYMAEMSSRGLKPDAFVYSSMLNVCARSGLEDEAKTLFEEMQASGIKAAIYHYAPLLNMYAEKKKPEEAEKVFEDFQKTGLPLNEVILNSLIKAYLSCGYLEKAIYLFEEMPSVCGSRGEVTYSLMMDAYCKAGLVEKAQSLFEELKKKDAVPGNYIYSILISAYSKLGRADMVTSLSKDLENRKKGMWDPVLFNSVLKSFCELGMMDSVMNTLKRMNEESVSPDRATFNILICFFCKQGMFDIALHTLEDLKVRNLRPNVNSYAPLITELANTGKVDQALEIFPEMRENGIQPPASVLCPVIDSLCREQRLDEAFKYFKDLLITGTSPLPSCTQNILMLAGKDLGTLEELLGNSFMPSVDLNQVDLATVLSAYEKQGLYAAMNKLLDYLKEQNISVGKHDTWSELISNLKQDGHTEILAKLKGQTSKMPVNAVPSAP